MTDSEITEILGGWKGYEIESPERHEKEGRPQIWVYRRPVAGVPMICSGCVEPRLSVHDTEDRSVRELPILEA